MATQLGRTTRAPRGSVLVDTKAPYGTSPATHFKTLLRSMQRALKAGDTTVVLSGARLNVVILALQKSIWVEEEVIPRDLYAFGALNARGVSHEQRLRTVATRMLRRPDRDRPGRSASYPAERIVAEYRALTGQGEGDTSFYSSRQLCGLSREREDFEPIRLPLNRADAVRAIQRVHGFPSHRAARQFIQAVIRELPKLQRPKLPAADH
jgi:hypothetical protein